MTDVESPVEVLAMISGKPLTELPKDLFIPADALEILLESFSGPLDLLWYLIRRQNIDIMNIPIVLITQQYMEYIELMEANRLELAADYLVMAAWLAEIKSKLLLPLPPKSLEDEIEEDPRAALVKRLYAYEQFKQASMLLEHLPRFTRDVFPLQLPWEPTVFIKEKPSIPLASLADIMKMLLFKQSHQVHHQVQREQWSVSERILFVLDKLAQKPNMDFPELLSKIEGRMGLVVTFLAILELAKQSLLVIIQAENDDPIRIEES